MCVVNYYCVDEGETTTSVILLIEYIIQHVIQSVTEYQDKLHSYYSNKINLPIKQVAYSILYLLHKKVESINPLAKQGM